MLQIASATMQTAAGMTWEWSDLRYFLGVARAGTTAGAARALGVNQTTCARRIAALERALGARLFDRTAGGYPLTPLGSALLPHAEQAEAAADGFARTVADWSRAQGGVIRLATSDFLARSIAEPAVDALARTRPHIRVELMVDSHAVDLDAGEADLALRAEEAIAGDGLIARKLMPTPWAVYCSQAFADRVGTPEQMADFLRLPVATLSGRPASVLRALDPAVDVRFTTNSMLALADRVARGDCAAAMPAQVGDARPDLRRCFLIDSDAALWIVYHERVRGRADIRLLIDAIVAQCQKVPPPPISP